MGVWNCFSNLRLLGRLQCGQKQTCSVHLMDLFLESTNQSELQRSKQSNPLEVRETVIYKSRPPKHKLAFIQCATSQFSSCFGLDTCVLFVAFTHGRQKRSCEAPVVLPWFRHELLGSGGAGVSTVPFHWTSLARWISHLKFEEKKNKQTYFFPQKNGQHVF